VTTTLVVALLAALQAVAIWRKPDQVTWILVACFAVAVIVAGNVPLPERFTVLALIDYALVAAMIGPWAVTHSRRAQIIGVIGLVKLVARLTYASHPYMDHWTFAAVMNCAFAAQVIVAGGLADGIGRWLSDHCWFGRSRAAGLHRNGLEQ
jgi:hypothetical protein